MEKNLKSLARSEPKKRGHRLWRGKKKLISLLLVLVLLAVIAFAGWSYYNLRQTKLNLEKAQATINDITDPQKQQELLKEETQKVLDKVKKHILTPTDEEPVLSVITDIDKLVADQPFFKDAHNGDKILMFQKAGWGLVYDPTRDIIVKVAQIDTSGSNTSANTDNTKNAATGTQNP